MSEPELIDYLLGELAPAEARRVERRLAADPALRAEADRLRPLIGGLEALGPEDWDVVAPAPPVAAAPAPAGRTSRMPRLAAVAACLAAAVAGVGVVALVRGDDGPEPLELARLADPAATPAAAGEARLVADGSGLEVDLRGLRPSGPDASYELWLLDGPRATLPLGAVRVPASGAARVRVPAPPDLARYRYIDVSLEPRDGDPAHSGRSVLRAESRGLPDA